MREDTASTLTDHLGAAVQLDTGWTPRAGSVSTSTNVTPSTSAGMEPAPTLGEVFSASVVKVMLLAETVD